MTREITAPEASNRLAAAQNIAKRLQANGITEGDLNALESNATAKKSFWENAGQFHRSGYSPSKDTIDAVKDILRGGEVATGKAAVQTPAYVPQALQSNPRALDISRRLLQEMYGVTGSTPMSGLNGGK